MSDKDETATVKLYGPRGLTGTGYEIKRDVRGWFWEWHEEAEENDVSADRWDSRSDALLSAADDWARNGSYDGHGDRKDSLTGLLRSLAARSQ